MRSFPILLLALLVAVLAIAAPADAAQKKVPKLKPVSGKLKAKVGIADQKAQFFTDQRFKSLKLKIARRSVAWDFLQYDWQTKDVDDWMSAARRARVTPVITFARSRVDAKRHEIPSASQIRRAFKAFRARYPWAKEFVASNESNHYGEPTGRRPQLAAAYYRAMRKECRSCKIAGATLLDQPNLVSWSKKFVKAAKEQPKYWALHNYVSANRFQTTRTIQLLRAVKGQIWLTEVGGLVKRRTADKKGKAKLKEGVAHAARVTDYIFNRLARVSPRITRIYLYHWNSDGPLSSWDSGLFDHKGKARPAFTKLRSFLKGGRKGGVEKLGKGKRRKVRR
jgi:Glycosyl hydrolase catalytic core